MVSDTEHLESRYGSSLCIRCSFFGFFVWKSENYPTKSAFPPKDMKGLKAFIRLERGRAMFLSELSLIPALPSHAARRNKISHDCYPHPDRQVSQTMNVLGRRILSTPRALARFSSTTTVVPPHPPTSSTPTFATETAVSDYPQAPNHPGLWSENQRPRPTPATGPRFEQTAMQLQPQPLSAMDLIAKEPIRLSKTRIAACDGGVYYPAFPILSSSFPPRVGPSDTTTSGIFGPRTIR